MEIRMRIPAQATTTTKLSSRICRNTHCTSPQCNNDFLLDYMLRKLINIFNQNEVAKIFDFALINNEP